MLTDLEDSFQVLSNTTSLLKAVEYMYAERIGHGYHTTDDPELYEQCRKKNLHFEICPLSSIRTGAVPADISLHPLSRFAFKHSNNNYTITRVMLIRIDHLILGGVWELFIQKMSCYAPVRFNGLKIYSMCVYVHLWLSLTC